MADSIGAQADKVKNVVRIGKKKEADPSGEPQRPRPLKISMIDNESKRHFMRNVHKLKQSDAQSDYSRLSVAHDMTPTEREENKKKIQEAKDRNMEHSSENFKFVVRGPPWERRVVKIPKEQ